MGDEVLLKINDLSAHFSASDGQVGAVDEVSFSVRSGEIFGIVGESGCGKSVTMDCILRLLPDNAEITKGHIFFSVPEDILSRIDRLLAEHRRLEKEGLSRNDEGERSKELKELLERWDLLWMNDSAMRKLRGKEIAMVFQDPISAMDPVMCIGEQIAEAIITHDLSGLAGRLLDEENGTNGSRGDRSFVSYNMARTRWGLFKPLYERVRSDPTDRFAMICSKIPVIDRYMRPLENIAYERAIGLLQDMGLPEPEAIARSYPFELSGGMLQRAAMAMALAGEPRLLIADEPTTSLDVTVQSQILGLFESLKKEKGMSVILITHNFAVVAEVCDRAAVMYAGSIVEEGDVLQLFDGPLHPYTIALMGSIPRLCSGAEMLRSIPGSVPGPSERIGGCRFHPRCSRSFDRCRSERPMLNEVGPGHKVACHLFGGEKNG